MSESTKVVTSIRVTSNEARTNSYNGENCRDKITQDVIISLPNWLVILLNEYEKEGYIETNKFIADSISDFINTSNLDKDALSININSANKTNKILIFLKALALFLFSHFSYITKSIY